MSNWPKVLGYILTDWFGRQYSKKNLQFRQNLVLIWVSNPPGSPNVLFFPLFFFLKSHPLYDQTVLCFLYFLESVSNFILFFNLLHFSVFHPSRWQVKSFFIIFFSFCDVKSFANSFQIISKINPIYTTKTTLFFPILGCPPLLWRIFFGSNSKLRNWNYITSSSTPERKTPTKKLKFQAWT